jgi:protein gp37
LSRCSSISAASIGASSAAKAARVRDTCRRDVRDQCRAAGVPLFMKQMSRREPIPEDLLIREFPLNSACQDTLTCACD